METVRRYTAITLILVSLSFFSSGLVAQTPPKPEAIKFIPATPEQQKNSPSGMVYVPAGDFMMGCNEAVDKQCFFNVETPYHKVYLDAFYIDKYEVTNEQYGVCVQAGKCSKPYTGGSFNWRVSDRGKYPIHYVDWNQADAFCKWAGKRLPTEAEWEKAARGTNGRTYPWGEGIDCGKANYAACNNGKTKPVGSYPAGASPYGVMDMAGNVWEWVGDRFDENYYKNSPNRNPTGPGSGQARVLRSGSWNFDPYNLRASSRNWCNPGNRYYDFGARCAKTP